MLNNQSVLDTRNLLTGKDGQLMVTLSDNTQLFLAEVDQFNAKLSVSNTDYQPVGSALEFGVPTGYRITLSFTEAVVRDDPMFEKLIEDLQNGIFPEFTFQGKLSRRRDGQYQRQVFRYCIPDGDIDLMNLVPGEIVKRQWNFRVNAVPEMLESFKTA